MALKIWQGKSRFNGEDISAYLTYKKSENRKTGEIPQVWILADAMSPTDAVASGDDRAVCHLCEYSWYRRKLTGSKVKCYVLPFAAPRSVWVSSRDKNVCSYRDYAPIIKDRVLRLGAYGDPCAVPISVWYKLRSVGLKRMLAYTHQWHLKGNQRYRSICLASTTPDNREHAIALGWKTFTTVPKGSDYDKPCLCPASTTSPHYGTVTCGTCGLCDPNVESEHPWLYAH